MFFCLLENSPNLSEIHLKSIRRNGLQLIASLCGLSLRVIDASVTHDVDILQTICKACPNLRVLNLGCTVVGEPGDGIIQAAVQYCPNIEVVPSDPRWRLTSAGIDPLATIHTLRELTAIHVTNTSESVQRVIQANPHLTKLFVFGPLVDDALVNCIGRCCVNLKNIKLTPMPETSLSEQALITLFRGCPLLMSVNMNLRSMSNAALRAMFHYCRGIFDLDLGLNNLAVSTTGQADEPVFDTDYPSPMMLMIHGRGFKDSVLRDIFTHCTSLIAVAMNGCVELTDETLITLARSRCGQLSAVELSGCVKVTAAAVNEVVTQCIHLMLLKLGDVTLTAEVLAGVSNLLLLQILELNDCKGPIAEEAVVLIATRCTSLCQFKVSGYKGKITPTLERMRKGELFDHTNFDIYRHSDST